MNNWGVSVKAETLIPRASKRILRFVTHRELDLSKSPRLPYGRKCMLNLREKNLKRDRIKNQSDNKLNENITSAEYQWKQIYSNISITRLDELKNSGDQQKISLVKSKTQIAEKTIMDTMGTALYNDGTTSNALVGLRAIVAASSTVGGISQSTNSWWSGQVDSSTATLSMAALQTVWNLCSIDSDGPTVAMATRANYNRFYALLQPQQRFMDAETAKGGFSSLMFNGIPFISDSHCPANHVFFLNENYLHLFVHKDEDLRFEPFQKPINQNVRVAKVYWMGALGSSNNRLHGKLSALTA